MYQKDYKNLFTYLFYNNNTRLQIGRKVILLGGGKKMKHFWPGKSIGISFLDKKNPILLMPTVGFEPTTSQSPSGGVTPRLVHRHNHSATVDW